MSEDVTSLSGPDDRIDTQSLPDWLGPNSSHPLENFQEFSSRGSQKSEVQLRFVLALFRANTFLFGSFNILFLFFKFRYLFQIMLESNYFEIAAIISVLLRDALSIVR